MRAVHRSAKATLDAQQVDVGQSLVAIYMSINTPTSIYWEANPNWLRSAARTRTYNTHATRALMTSRQYFPTNKRSNGLVRDVRLTQTRSMSAREHAPCFAIIERAEYPASNKLVVALYLAISHSFERFQVCSNSYVGAMTRTQSTAFRKLATSRFVATPPAPAM
jgi:hypothetical protein